MAPFVLLFVYSKGSERSVNKDAEMDVRSLPFAMDQTQMLPELAVKFIGCIRQRITMGS
jgi:hypothetical protein